MDNATPSQEKEAIRDFRNRNVNQFNQLHRGDVGTREFHDDAEALRNACHYHLPPLFDHIAQEFPNGKLLEIGCSMDNDAIQFARRGMKVTGVDITGIAVDYMYSTGWDATNKSMPTFQHRGLGKVIGRHLMIKATQ